jgi:histidine triad (HIT) family protein
MSIDGRYDESNIFAKALRGEIDVVKVFEDGETLAFMDLFPQSHGHALVVSKTSKARNILEIEPVALDQVMRTVQKTARAIYKALAPEGVIITQFNGAVAGQTIFHLHVHIIPRWADQALSVHGRSGPADLAVLTETARTIAGAFDERS